MGKAFDNAKLLLSANPTATVNIVGHSLGGWQAAHLAKQLNEVRCGAVDNLITLDPVGDSNRIHSVANIKYRTPKPDAKTWINVRVERPGVLTGFDNWIANFGGQWNPSKNSLPPHYSYTLEASHGDANYLLTSEVYGSDGTGKGFTPWDLLVKHYENLPSDYNYENAPESKR